MVKKIKFFFASIFVLLFLSTFFSVQAQSFKVVGYMINWGNGPNLINTFDYTKVTHINYAFQNPDASGNLVGSNTGLSTLVTKAHAANVKVLISLGGAGTDYDANLRGIWQNLVTAGNRAGFIQKIVAYVNANNLDGADIDIEGAGITSDYDGFVNALCDALHPLGKLVTAAIKSDYGNPNFVNTSLQKMDFMNVMAYDQTGNWSATPGQHSSYSYATGMIDYWKGRGAAASKLVLGVPFYGYGWNSNPGVWSFAQVLASFPGNANTDQAGNIIYYNGIQTIKDKTTYACQNGLGGVMIWELTNDVTGSNSLLQAINDSKGSCGATPPTISITSPANNASFNAPANITITAAASVSSGSISKVEFFNGSTSIGVDNSSPYSINWNNVASGTYTINAVATSNTGATATSAIVVHVIGPHGGTPWPIPGTVQAEDYDDGGQGFAYYDSTPGNSGAAYRNEDVDIEPMSGGGYDVGYTAAGEWMQYTVNVTSSGAYNFQFNIATTSTGKSFHVEMDGTNVTGAVNLPNTGAWGTFQVVTVNNVSLSQGKHLMKVYMDTDGFNLDYVKVVALPAPTITFNNITKTYGNASFAVSATSNSTGAITYSIVSGGAFATITPSGQVTIKGAGSVSIQASQAAAGGYNSGTSTATLTINKANLTITADNKTKVYNTANPALTYSYSGFVYGENASALSATPSISTTAVTNSAVGSYPIALSGGTAANYNINLVNGTLTVGKATPTLSYNGPTNGLQGSTITLSSSSNSTGAISYAESNGTGSATLSGNQLNLVQAGTVVITINLAATSNYNAASLTQTVTINPLTTPTVTFSNLTKTYGDAVFNVSASSNSPGAITYSIVSGSAFATITPSGQVTIKGAGSVSIQASQAASGSYSAGTATTTLTINKATLTITADNKTKVYNTANPALTYSYSGFVYGENASALSATPSISTTATTNSAVGSYSIALSGGAAANYNINLVNGTLTITEATPLMVFNNITKTYGDAPFTIHATSNSSGAITYAVVSGSQYATVGTDGSVTILKAGVVTLMAQQEASGSYASASATATLTINKALPVLEYTGLLSGISGSTITLSATSSSTGSITFESQPGGTGTATLSGTQLTLGLPGSVTVQISVTGDDNYLASSITQEIQVTTVTSINGQAAIGEHWNVFPNPAVDYTFVQLNLDETSTGKLVLLDASGRTLEIITQGVIEKDASYAISLTDYASGLYYIQLQTENGTAVKKVIK